MSIKKCENHDCKVYRMYHTKHFYHKDGYVEMKMRLSKDENRHHENLANVSSRIKQAEDGAILINSHCELCQKTIISKEVVTRQL